MLVDYEYRNKKLIVSYIDSYGNIKIKYLPWNNPTKFIIADDNDKQKSSKYVTWDGKAVKEVYTTYPNRYSVYDYLDSLGEEEQQIIFGYNEPNIFFVDIENEILEGKPEPHKGDCEIQAISIVNKDKVLVLGTRKLSPSQISSIEDGINNHFIKLNIPKYEFKYVAYDTEYEMLYNFFHKLVPKMSVITGWNYVQYDNVLLINRARKLNIDPSVMSFTGVLRKSFEENDHSELPAHRIIVDYMELYDKWDTSIKIKESKSLDFVSEHVIGNGVKKINYEGNLTYLYKNEYTKFILYNAIDSCLVQQIHNKMKYVDILYGISTLSRIKVQDAFTTLQVTEGILRGKMREEKNIVFVKEEFDRNKTYTGGMSVQGGWVKDPVVGMNSWTCCFDFASLYPTTIREFNISADSYRGQIIKDRGKDVMYMINKLHNTNEPVFSIFNGHKIELDKTDIITLNGAVFKNEDGVVKKVMSNIYDERKRYKKMMMTANEELKELEDEYEKLVAELEE